MQVAAAMFHFSDDILCNGNDTSDNPPHYFCTSLVSGRGSHRISNVYNSQPRCYEQDICTPDAARSYVPGMEGVHLLQQVVLIIVLLFYTMTMVLYCLN